jgi:hypothetical protein
MEISSAVSAAVTVLLLAYPNASAAAFRLEVTLPAGAAKALEQIGRSLSLAIETELVENVDVAQTPRANRKRKGRQDLFASTTRTTPLRPVVAAGDRAISFEWKNAEAAIRVLDRDERSGGEVCRCLGDCAQKQLSDSIGSRLLRTDLNDTRSPKTASRENCTEVQIVREHNMVMRSCPEKNFLVRGSRVSDGRPMRCSVTSPFEKVAPYGREIHVDQEFQDRAIGTSISSLRHAAYESASTMSPGSRYG